ncbi:MAG TPA: ribonuclease E/G [Alphaproteobacteria bacterium]|nr:ribonuclease E/G [Alphaproteobacteria bacterium]
MTKRMLIDATHPEETRVAVVDGTRLEEFDFEMAARRQIKSNIYLAKVTRVEPSLQAAFVEYGGNRHGFLPFPEIHPDYYRIPVGDRPRERDFRRHHDDEFDPAPDEVFEAPVFEAPHAEDDAPAAEADAIEETIETELATDAAPEETDSGETDAVIAEAAAADPTVSEEAPFEAEPEQGEGEAAEFAAPEGGVEEIAQEAGAVGDAATGEIVAIEEPVTVDVVGGDEVEEQQRRRRSQMPHYKIQEVIKRRQIMLVQVSKEERGNKGAAVTTFLSLPGRYCVLMPNTSRGGGVSRKIANPADRKRMKELISDLEVPDGMSVILRTAGVERSKAEIKRDLEYLLRLWENIRTLTLESTAPALIYEEGNLVKRAIRDLYTKDIDSIEIAGDEGYRQAKDFMRMLMPSHAKRVQPYRDPSIPLFHRYQVESQIDLIHNPVAHLKSGGYIVINQTEALVSIDVNSGRSTRERNIEETAVKTNCEAADEIARQLRLRDLGGLIVIDFIDMDEARHDAQVERRLKEAMKNDRARIQVGRISPFGLLELSRQRLHPSLIETNFHTCPHCLGTGLIRSVESASLLVLRGIEEEGIKHRAAEISITVAGNIALYILNQKRAMLGEIEQRYGFFVRVQADDSLIAPDYRLERIRAKAPGSEPPPLNLTATMAAHEIEIEDADEAEEEEETTPAEARGNREGAGAGAATDADGRRKRRRRRRRGRDRDRPEDGSAPQEASEDGGDETGFEAGDEAGAEDGAPAEVSAGEAHPIDAAQSIDDAHIAGEVPAAGDADAAAAEETAAEDGRKRRRGRRGGRTRNRRGDDAAGDQPEAAEGEAQPAAEAEPAAPEESWAANDDVPAAAEAPAEPAAEPLAEPTEPAATPEAASAPEPAQPEPEPEPPAPPPPRDYETVNQPPAQPKRGFWKRLVE